MEKKWGKVTSTGAIKKVEIRAADILQMAGDECPLLWSMGHMQVKRAGEVEWSAIACRWYRDLMREGECSATISGRWMLGIFQYCKDFIPTASAYGPRPSLAGPRRVFRQYRQD